MSTYESPLAAAWWGNYDEGSPPGLGFGRQTTGARPPVVWTGRPTHDGRVRPMCGGNLDFSQEFLQAPPSVPRLKVHFSAIG